MDRCIRLLYFFRVVSPVPRLIIAMFVVITCAAAVLIILHPSRTAAALVPILLLQLFAAASGFAVPARRGHYDLLLTAGDSRLAIAAAHWAMSVVPGAASWIVLGAVEFAVTRGASVAALASGSMAAMLLVSTLPWAMTVALPRFAGAIGWLSALALANVILAGEQVLRFSGGIVAGNSWFGAALALLLYPPVLAGEAIAGAHGLIVLPALLVAAVVMTRAFLWIDRTDIPLEAAQ